MSRPTADIQSSHLPACRAGHRGGIFRDPAFLAVAAVLLAAALGLNGAVQYLKVHFKKEPVPMQRRFKDVMPEILGPWVRAMIDPLTEEIEKELAAQDWLFCTYVNAQLFGRDPSELAREFAGMSQQDQRDQLARLTQRNPAAVLSLGLTYYTGKADTVAHIPERCYVADGYEPSEQPTVEWSVAGRPMKVRYITFENQRARASAVCNVAYFFHVNGRYEAESLAVRYLLQNLFERYGYYAKVELRTDNVERDTSAGIMQQFLGAALPEIEKALPDWRQYKSR